MLQVEFSVFSDLTLWFFYYKPSFNFPNIVQAQHINLCTLGRPIWLVPLGLCFFFKKKKTSLFELIKSVPKSTKVISLCGQLRDKGDGN